MHGSVNKTSPELHIHVEVLVTFVVEPYVCVALESCVRQVGRQVIAADIRAYRHDTYLIKKETIL